MLIITQEEDGMEEVWDQVMEEEEEVLRILEELQVEIQLLV